MDADLTEPPSTDRIFWPKWQVRFDNGTVYPASFGGVHLGTVAEKQASDSTHEPEPRPRPKPSRRHFSPPLDMLFIDHYVFEYYERPDAEIAFATDDGGLPTSLAAVEKVAISASSLSHPTDKDGIWLKKLRFILRNLPGVRAIAVLTAVVLDMASPASMPEPVYFMDIGNTSVHDRVRHGVLTGDELRMLPRDPETLRPSDFAVQEWDGLPAEWPAFGRLKARGTAPELYMGTMVFFGREWVSLDGVGAPGRPCRLGHRSADPMGAIVRRQGHDAALAAQAATGASEKNDLKKADSPSTFSLRRKGSRLALMRKASSLSVRGRPSKAKAGSQKTVA